MYTKSENVLSLPLSMQLEVTDLRRQFQGLHQMFSLEPPELETTVTTSSDTHLVYLIYAYASDTAGVGCNTEVKII